MGVVKPLHSNSRTVRSAFRLARSLRFTEGYCRIWASSSVALTLAEGSGKRTPVDQRRFYAIAYGSFRECLAIIELEKLNDTTINKLQDQLG
ncbi:MAG: hypothetical protein C5B49_08975, partial [Bdellovibrio sp.]